MEELDPLAQQEQQQTLAQQEEPAPPVQLATLALLELAELALPVFAAQLVQMVRRDVREILALPGQLDAGGRRERLDSPVISEPWVTEATLVQQVGLDHLGLLASLVTLGLVDPLVILAAQARRV